MTLAREASTALSRGAGWPPPGGTAWERTAVGGFFLLTAGVHVGIVGTDPGTYAPFADHALLGVVRAGWEHVFMASPTFWGLVLAAGEAALGTLLLVGGRPARAGWAGVLLFHAALLLFGPGFWLYAVPAGAVLTVLALRDHRRSTS